MYVCFDILSQRVCNSVLCDCKNVLGENRSSMGPKFTTCDQSYSVGNINLFNRNFIRFKKMYKCFNISIKNMLLVSGKLSVYC